MFIFLPHRLFHGNFSPPCQTFWRMNFKKAKRTVLAVNGTKKAELLKKVVDAKNAVNQLPATALYDFENASLYCDKDAGALIA